jgi:hypothetical protein
MDGVGGRKGWEWHVMLVRITILLLIKIIGFSFSRVSSR